MILNIILGIATAWVTLLLGNLFWSSQRRTRAIRIVLADTSMLTKYVTPEILAEPPAVIAHFARPLHGGYGVNMEAFQTSDRVAQRRGKILVGVLAIATFVGSAFLGPVFVVINVALFLLLLLDRPGQSAGQQAIEWIQITGVLLRRWQESSPGECAAFVSQRPDLRALQDHVTRRAT